MQATTLYRAEGLDPLVAISDDGRLLATLGGVMLGWTIVPAANAEPGTEAAIRAVSIQVRSYPAWAR